MIKKNIFANLVGRAWAFISVYLFVPLYLDFLGIESFGLVGFYTTLLGVLAFADLGFTATLNREMARLSALPDSQAEMRTLLRTYEITYLCISLTLVLAIWLLSPLISKNWLNSNRLQPHEIEAAIRLMGVAIAVQLPAGLYVGGLLGLQQQVTANRLQILWGMYRAIGGILILWMVSATVIAFFAWQLVANIIYCISVRRGLWATLPAAKEGNISRFSLGVFNGTWRYALGISGMAVISILLTQSDKLVVSKLLQLEMLGIYSIAGSLASIPMMLASPVAQAVFPRFTALVANSEQDRVVEIYHLASKLTAIAVIPAGLTFAVFSFDFVHAWTGSLATAEKAASVASLLVLGQSMQAITLIPFHIALAHGNVKLNIKIGIFSVLLVIPLLNYLVLEFGLIGAGWSWMVMNIVTLPPYMYLLHRRFLPGQLKDWAVQSVIFPILAAFPCVVLGKIWMPQTESRMIIFLSIGLTWFMAVAVSVLLSSDLRQRLLGAIRDNYYAK